MKAPVFASDLDAVVIGSMRDEAQNGTLMLHELLGGGDERLSPVIVLTASGC